MTRPFANVGLSSTCVSYLAPDGMVRVVDGVNGTEYELSRERFVTLLASDAPELDRKLPASLRASPQRKREFAEAGLITSTTNPSLLTPVELACHRQLNQGGHDSRPTPVGCTNRTPGPAAAAIQLPLLEDFGASIDLVECLARRSSKRAYADMAMSFESLAGLLQLSCRTRALVEQPGPRMLPLRPYPSGGAKYSLEVYPIVSRVTGVPSGVFRYDPADHALTPLAVSSDAAALLFELARDSMWGVMRGSPSVVFVITSVFARTASAYRFNAYHLILEELGALYQTIYLAAERLGLAACALGQIKERLVGRWLGLDGMYEAQVGMLALGVPEPTQDTFTVDTAELLAEPPIRGSDVVRLDAGGVAFTIPLDELALDVEPEDTLTFRWQPRSILFVLGPAASRAVATRLSIDGDQIRWTSSGRAVRVSTTDRLRRHLASST